MESAKSGAFVGMFACAFAFAFAYASPLRASFFELGHS
jgi:hypothetical protein